MNKTSAKEWLVKVWHDLSSANILSEAEHYTDRRGADLRYALEKSFKTFLAYQNKKIPKTHDLLELNEMVHEYIELYDNDIYLLHIANKYHIEESYPVFNRPLPTREEIRNVISFSEKIFSKTCELLEIDKNEIKQ